MKPIEEHPTRIYTDDWRFLQLLQGSAIGDMRKVKTDSEGRFLRFGLISSSLLSSFSDSVVGGFLLWLSVGVN
ncbi:hypothetical protein Hanom_Chr10g00966371 [Helianthus anomalus]